MSIDEIVAALKAIVDGAEGRDITDEEADRYAELEAQLAVAKRSSEIRSRTEAYTTPVGGGLQIMTKDKGPDTLDRAFEAYLRTGKANQDIAELRALQVGTDSEGGYTVPPGFRQKLVEVRKAFGGLAAEVDSFTTDSGTSLEFPTLDDTANVGSITAEEAAFADGADLAFGTVTMGAFKYTSSGTGTTTPLRVSVELLQDSAFDIAGLVARALGTRIARKQASDWVKGGGTTLPFGLLHAGLTTDVTTAESTITYAKLLELEGLLDPEYEQNAKWIMNKKTWTAIRAIEDDMGRPLIFDQAASGISGRPEKTLLGYPVVIDQACIDYDVDGVNGHFLALGDLREAYVIRRVSPLVVVVNPWTRMNNGQVEYVAWERADGNIQNRKAYKIMDNVTT